MMELPDKEVMRELFERYHRERYNPASEHYRFEHFWDAVIKAQEDK